MTKEEWAGMLDGRAINFEVLNNEEAEIRDAGLVVIYGYSDDNVELCGAISDELSAYDGTTICVNASGVVKNECDDEDCPNFKGFDLPGNYKIDALWCDGDGPAWTYKTDIPHATFDIMKEGEIFCRGIVFSMDALK